MAFDISKLKTENAKAWAIIIIVVVGVVLAAYLISKTFGSISGAVGDMWNGIKGIPSDLGLTDTQAETDQKAKLLAATQAAATPTSPWSPQFYKNAPNGASLMTSASGDALAKQIWDSVSWFQWGPPDGSIPEGAIKQCSTQSQVSFLADRFQQKYGKDLYTWLNGCFSGVLDAPSVYTLSVLNDYVNSLPKYN